MSIDTLPDLILEFIFSKLSLCDLGSCLVVCSRWYSILGNEDHVIWRLHCVQRLGREMINSSLLASLPTCKAKLRSLFYAWNPNDCSRHMSVKANGFTVHRNNQPSSTDGVRGKIGLGHGRHAWEIMWNGPLGSVASIGIATKQAALQAAGYVPLLGSDYQSWGWNLSDNQLFHNAISQGHYPLESNVSVEKVAKKIRVILDCENKTLAFEQNYEYLGIAFRGLPDNIFYPAVCAVYGRTEVSMVYLGPLCAHCKLKKEEVKDLREKHCYRIHFDA